MQEAVQDMSDIQVDDELGLLDILMVLAGSAKLLLLGPLLAGVIGLGVAFVLPKTYESTAWLRLLNNDKFENSAAADISSDDVLAPVLKSASWITRANPGREQALEELRKTVQATYNKRDGLLILKVQADTPEDAQALARAVIESYRQFTLPKGRTLETTNQQIALNQEALKDVKLIIERVSKNMDKVTPGTEGDNVARAYINLTEQRITREKTLQDLTMTLKGFGDEAFVQEPSLPEKPIKPKKALVAIFSAVGVAFFLLIWVFGRHAFHALLASSSGRAKWEQIRQIRRQRLGV